MAKTDRPPASDWFDFQASKFKPKPSYPDSKLRVWTKPEKAVPADEMKVEESTDSPSVIMRIIGKFRGE